MPVLDQEFFARAFGCDAGSLGEALRARIAGSGFRYQALEKPERDATILRVLRRLESGEVTRVGEHRQEVWERGWEENLEAYSREGFALESLLPRFIRPEPMIRVDADFVRAENPRFEFEFHDVVRRWICRRFMQGVSAVYEFGCGSSYNLVACAEELPGVRLVGLDWAMSAVRLASLIGEKRNLPLVGKRFNLFDPDSALEIGPGDAALTICALEQVGPKHGAFVDYLLEKRPAVCVHMEPIVDFYEQENLVDHLAIRFHNSRGYLSGFLGHLRDLESSGRIELIEARRLRFGSLFHEGYSVVAWRVR